MAYKKEIVDLVVEAITDAGARDRAKLLLAQAPTRDSPHGELITVGAIEAAFVGSTVARLLPDILRRVDEASKT